MAKVQFMKVCTKEPHSGLLSFEMWNSIEQESSTPFEAWDETHVTDTSEESCHLDKPECTVLHIEMQEVKVKVHQAAKSSVHRPQRTQAA